LQQPGHGINFTSGKQKGHIDMLRVKIQPTADGTTLKLEGKLGGSWVQNLERLWQHARENALYRPVRVDLTSVLFVDQDGKRVLEGMHEDGAELIGKNHSMKSVVEEGE
jgi:anti-anti-sigma regulatory factor